MRSCLDYGVHVNVLCVALKTDLSLQNIITYLYEYEWSCLIKSCILS